MKLLSTISKTLASQVAMALFSQGSFLPAMTFDISVVVENQLWSEPNEEHSNQHPHLQIRKVEKVVGHDFTVPEDFNAYERKN